MSEAPGTDSNNSNDDTSAEETASTEAADYPEGTIIFDWNPEEFAFLGHTLKKGIVPEYMTEQTARLIQILKRYGIHLRWAT